jgi:ABC-type glycerol-3-phosphate transport system substrate-binding protein
MKWIGTVVILLCVLTGCGGNDNRGTITVTYNCAANAAEVAVLEKEIPVFAESSGVSIVLHPFTGQEKLYAMMAADKAPDIFYTSGIMRDELAASGRILDLREVSSGDPFVTRLWPHVVEGGLAPDGGWYSVGNWEFTCGVYYRKDLFDAAGLRPPDTSWTWDDMVATARKLTVHGKPGEEPSRYGIYCGSHFVEALEIMNGSRFPRGSASLVLPPTSLEVYREYIGLVSEGLMPDLRRIQALGMQAPQLLQTGRVAMLVEAVPHQSLIETLTVPWGVAPLPRFPGKEPAYFRSASGGLSISSRTADPRAAWKALKWIIAGASIYQPNPVLRDVDFVGGWEQRYPAMRVSGFREVWDLSLRHNGGDPRFFVRFSSWTSGPILERLQPLLDRVWAREMTVDDLAARVHGINAEAAKAMQVKLRTSSYTPLFNTLMKDVLRQLEESGAR